MNTATQAQAESQVPLVSPEDYTDDAERLRMFASDPHKTFMDKFFQANLINRQIILGSITQDQADTLTAYQLADIIEMGVK
jgi:hypothetical protein